MSPSKDFSAIGQSRGEIGRDPPVLGIFLYALPSDVQRLAVKNYKLWQHDPNHPSLHFRRLKGSEDRFTVRIGDHYRALGRLSSGIITWVWIGTHSEYDKLMRVE